MIASPNRFGPHLSFVRLKDENLRFQDYSLILVLDIISIYGRSLLLSFEGQDKHVCSSILLLDESKSVSAQAKFTGKVHGGIHFLWFAQEDEKNISTTIYSKLSWLNFQGR